MNVCACPECECFLTASDGDLCLDCAEGFHATPKSEL